MHPLIAQSVAADRAKDLQRQAATMRLARQTRLAKPVPQSRMLRQFIAIARTASASPRPA